MVRALLIVLLLSSTAFADATLGREMCTSTTRYRGATRDLDVKDADIRDVFRLLADTGKINLVVADDVAGRVTMRLKNVPWDQILCTIAAVHKLRVTIDRSIVMVTRKPSR
jgi:type II secretory pathway component HofQ